MSRFRERGVADGVLDRCFFFDGRASALFLRVFDGEACRRSSQELLLSVVFEHRSRSRGCVEISDSRKCRAIWSKLVCVCVMEPDLRHGTAEKP